MKVKRYFDTLPELKAPKIKESNSHFQWLKNYKIGEPHEHAID